MIAGFFIINTNIIGDIDMATTKQKLVERGKTLNWKIEKEKFETIIDSKAIITQADTHIEEKMVSENSFINVIDTRNNPDNSNDKVYIYPFVANTYNTLVGKKFTIDWGDDTSTIITDGVFTQTLMTHEYATAGEYTITVESETGEMPSFTTSQFRSINNNNYKLIKILSPFLPVINSSGGKISPFHSSFTVQSSVKLNYIPSNLFKKMSYLNGLREFFLRCESLTSIPTGIFDNLPNISDITRLFKYCYSLRTIPDNLFEKNLFISAFGETFRECNNLIINPKVFGNLETRFNNLPNSIGSVSFYSTFYQNEENVVSGTAPEIWNCTFKKQDGTILTPSKSSVFSNCSNLTNYSNIPSDWK